MTTSETRRAAAPIPVADDRSAALAELVDRLTARAQAGERLDPDAVAAEYPEFADRLRQLLPAVSLLGELSRSREPLALENSQPDLLAGTLGDYRIIREVGRGGMGVVYEAEQISLARRVALKVLPFAAVMDPRQLLRFKNEARAAATLDHPNVVKVYGVGCERGVHFIAMQFVDGRSMADLIRERRGVPAGPPVNGKDATRSYTADITDHALIVAQQRAHSGTPIDVAFIRRATEWGIRAAEALEHAHSMGTVHRDVKPGNLLIDGRGEVFVVDFGLAKVASDPGVTGTGDVLGTLRYMSPEQAGSRHDLVDPRSDVYSLGATLYELLTLTPAFDGDRQEVLSKIATIDPVAPRKLDRRIPRDLETVILKAMEKDPARRYQSANEFAEDLRRVTSNEPVRARRAGYLDRVAKWSRRHRVAVWSGVILLVVTATVSSVAAVAVWAQKEAREQALKEKTDALADREQAIQDQREALASAGRRLVLTRKAADEMYTEVAEEWLAQQPGLQPKQREMLAKARDLYEELGTESGNDPRDRFGAAMAAHKLAMIEARLGATDRAGESSGRAVAALGRLAAEYPGRLEYLNALAVSQFGLAQNLFDANRLEPAREALTRCGETVDRMGREFPGSPETRRRRLWLFAGWAMLHSQAGRHAEAVEAARQGLAAMAGIADESLSEEDTVRLATTLVNGANALGELDQRPEAEAWYTWAVKLLDRLTRAHPRKPSYRNKLAQATMNLGIVVAEQGKDARGLLGLAAGQFEQLVLQFPDVREYRESSAKAYGNYGLVLPPRAPALGQPDRARAYRKAVEQLERLVADFGEVAPYRRDLGTQLGNLGQLLWDHNEADAGEVLRRGIDVWEKATQDFPKAKTFRDSESKARLALATRLLLRFPDRPQNVAEASALALRAIEVSPGHPDPWWVLGWARGLQEDWAGSAAALERYAEIGKQSPPRPTASLWHAIACWHLGRVQQARQLYHQAQQALEKEQNRSPDELTSRLRAEAAKLLGLVAPLPRAKESP